MGVLSRTFRVAVLALALLAATTSCTVRPVGGPAISASALESHVGRMVSEVAPADSAAVARRARYAADRLGSAGVQPIFQGSFYKRAGMADRASGMREIDPSRSHIVGYVAGRDARVSRNLVLVTAGLESPAMAAVLEVARTLVVAGRTAIEPGATVGIALWRPGDYGAAGPRDFVASPPWALHAVSGVVHIALDGGEHGAMQAVWEGAGIPFEVVTPPSSALLTGAHEHPDAQVTRLYQLAHAALARVTLAASVDHIRARHRTSVL